MTPSLLHRSLHLPHAVNIGLDRAFRKIACVSNLPETNIAKPTNGSKLRYHGFTVDSRDSLLSLTIIVYEVLFRDRIVCFKTTATASSICPSATGSCVHLPPTELRINLARRFAPKIIAQVLYAHLLQTADVSFASLGDVHGTCPGVLVTIMPFFSCYFVVKSKLQATF